MWVEEFKEYVGITEMRRNYTNHTVALGLRVTDWNDSPFLELKRSKYFMW